LWVEILRRDKVQQISLAFFALNVVSGAVSIVCRQAFKLKKYLIYILVEASPKVVKISSIKVS